MNLEQLFNQYKEVIDPRSLHYFGFYFSIIKQNEFQ